MVDVLSGKFVDRLALCKIIKSKINKNKKKNKNVCKVQINKDKN